MRQIQLSLQARRDLEEIEDYISHDNVDAAARLISNILDKFVLISEHPGIGRNRADLRSNLRSIVCGSYVIFYSPATDGVEVMRVLHGARDISELF